MAGSGSGIRSTNVFAALDSLKKKKKSDKGSKGSSKNSSSAKESEAPPVFWPPVSTLEGKSWADVDDDDDYYATNAPPPTIWGSSEQKKEIAASVEMLQEIESEDDFVDGDEDDEEEEPEPEPEAEAELPAQAEPVLRKPPSAPVAPKDTERQLSKKELKKKELAELEAVLAELGISGNDNKSSGQNETNDVAKEKRSEEQRAEGEMNGSAPVPTESKTSKKKKAKKDKSSKVVKDSVEQSNGLDAKVVDEEEDKSTVDMKERLNKVASMKKKKSSKEMDAAAKAAAVEAAARSAKLAASKKREKNHYNQQPVR